MTNDLPTLDHEPVALTKAIIQDRAKAIIELIDEGQLKATDVLLNMKSITDLLDALKDELRTRAVDELSNYTKGEEIVRYGARFEVVEAGTKYDYSVCGDPDYDYLTERINELTAQRKEREKFLKAMKTGVTIVNEETGEVLRVIPPTKSSTTTVKITWSKD